MPLRQRRVVGPQHQRQVSEYRRRPTQGLVDENLAWRVRDVILAADHVRDRHQRVVMTTTAVVGGRRRTERGRDRRSQSVLKRHLATDEVLERHVAIPGT